MIICLIPWVSDFLIAYVFWSTKIPRSSRSCLRTGWLLERIGILQRLTSTLPGPLSRREKANIWCAPSLGWWNSMVWGSLMLSLPRSGQCKRRGSPMSLNTACATQISQTVKNLGKNIPLNLKNILYRGSKSKAMIESQPDAREHHLSSDIWYERFQTKIVATDRCIWALEHQYHIQFASCGQKWLYNTPVLKPICTILQTKNVPHLIRILSTKNIANHSFSSGTWAVSGLRLPGVWGCSDWPGWNWVQFFGSNEWGPDKGVHATSLQQNSFI